MPAPVWQEAILFSWVVANSLDMAHQQLLLRRRRVTLTQPFGRLLAIGDGVLVVACLARAVSALPLLLPAAVHRAFVPPPLQERATLTLALTLALALALAPTPTLTLTLTLTLTGLCN